MQDGILILTSAGDVHAYAVAEALRIKGTSPVLWHTSDFPSQASETVSFSGTRNRLKIREVELELDDPQARTVWRRRPAHTLPDALLDPSDIEFAQQECLSFRRGVFTLLCPRAFWVNPTPAAIHASSKLTQLKVAAEEGFVLPETVASNDPNEIRSFIESQGGRAVYKTFSGGAWESETSVWMPYTSLITREDLVADSILRLTPGIFQAEVAKAFELRITAMGRSVFSAKVLSQSTETGRLDWRKSYGELRFEPFSLPVEIADNCIRMLRKLGLVFGCFDLIVTPSGDYVFLEVNEMGQFLFVEHATDLPLLDAFSDFLLEANPDFYWEAKRSAVCYSDVKDIVREQVGRFLKLHMEPTGNSFREDTRGSSEP